MKKAGFRRRVVELQLSTGIVYQNLTVCQERFPPDSKKKIDSKAAADWAGKEKTLVANEWTPVRLNLNPHP